MLVRVIGCQVQNERGSFHDGEIITVSDRDAKRLIKLGFGEPVKKKITLGVDVTPNTQASEVNNEA